MRLRRVVGTKKRVSFRLRMTVLPHVVRGQRARLFDSLRLIKRAVGRERAHAGSLSFSA